MTTPEGDREWDCELHPESLVEMKYRIRTVAEMTGIPRNTLIAWERRYGFIRPERRDNGYRSYSEADIEKLRRVQNALKAGLKISEAIQLLEQVESEATEAPSQGGRPAALLSLEEVSRLLADALVNYRREEAEELLRRISTVPFEERLTDVFFPVLRAIGDLWEAGKVSVAQEHYASAIIRTHFAGILLGLGSRGPKAPHAACTTFVEEQHELTALAMAIRLALAGYRVTYLGPNLPAEEVVGFCRTQKADLLCVSVINDCDSQVLADYTSTVSALAPATRVVLGGRVLEGKQSSPGVEYIPNWTDFTT
jgi:DNA-binding transcriptional MerR regulator